MVNSKMKGISIFLLTVMRRHLYCFLLNETLFKCNFLSTKFCTFKVRFSKFSVAPFFSNNSIAPSEGPETLKIFLFLENCFLAQNLMSVIRKSRSLAVIYYFFCIYSIRTLQNTIRN